MEVTKEAMHHLVSVKLGFIADLRADQMDDACVSGAIDDGECLGEAFSGDASSTRSPPKVGGGVVQTQADFNGGKHRLGLTEPESVSAR